MSQGMRNIVSWSKEEEEVRVERQSLNDVVGEELIIERVQKRESERYGEYFVITDDEGREYYSFSKLVMRQIERMQELIEKGYKVRAKVKMNNRGQVYFGKPDGD